MNSERKEKDAVSLRGSVVCVCFTHAVVKPLKIIFPNQVRIIIVVVVRKKSRIIQNSVQKD